jgi:hypothetical protein
MLSSCSGSCPNAKIVSDGQVLHPGDTLQPDAGGYTRILLHVAADRSNVDTRLSLSAPCPFLQ